MRELLKYAFLLALGAAIGAYIVLSFEDDAGSPAQRDAVTAHLEPGPPATPASIEEEELEYTVAKRLASLEGWPRF